MSVSLGNIVHNAKEIKGYCGGVKLCAMVKSNAYGHGLLPVAGALTGFCDYFGVARICEAKALRQAGIENNILVCSEYGCESVVYAADENITLTVSSLSELEGYNKAAKESGKRLSVHVKVDSGMNRLGIKDISELYDMLRLLKKSGSVVLDGIYTHFCDTKSKRFTEKQYKFFMESVSAAKKEFPGICAHCAASKAIFKDKKYCLDMVRPGLFLYGYDTAEAAEKGVSLLPAMEAYSSVLAVKKASGGEFIGYNRSYKVKEDMFYAVIGAGYGDGLKRPLSGRASVIIGGAECRITGNICMDSFMARLDKTAAEKIRQGEKVLLFSDSGNNASVSYENNSAICGTIVYELLTSFTERVEREYIN